MTRDEPNGLKTDAGPERKVALDLWPSAEARAGGEITLRKLRAFWAIARSSSLTKAAKSLGVTQPTLSQQLTSLESALGVQLFERRSNRMELTETGIYLLRKAEHVLRSVQELEDELSLTGGPGRRMIRVAGVTSVLRTLLPETMHRLVPEHPGIEYDIQEGAPVEILEMLYTRRVTVGLMSATSVAEIGAGFLQVPILEDPYVLAVPERIDLGALTDPERELGDEEFGILNSTIQFVFGTQHSRRVQDWFDRHLPENRLRARVRSFELALDMVRADIGVCITPSLSTLIGNRPRAGIRLYRTEFEPRRIVAMIPAHFRRIDLYSDFLDALQTTARGVSLPRPDVLPPFMTAPGSGA